MFGPRFYGREIKVLGQVSAAVLALALFGCNEKPAEQANTGRPVLVTTIHYVMGATMPETVMASGQLYRWKSSRDGNRSCSWRPS